MSITARWSGYCSECGERWQPGDQIRSVVVGYEHMERWVHDRCPDVPELRDFIHAAHQVGKAARDFAAAMGMSTSEAVLMLTEAMEALAPRNLITIHPDTIRRMHAAALHRREE